MRFKAFDKIFLIHIYSIPKFQEELGEKTVPKCSFLLLLVTKIAVLMPIFHKLFVRVSRQIDMRFKAFD